MQLCVRYMHSLGPEGVREAMKSLRARHKFVISENVAREFYDASVRSIRCDPDRDADDQVYRHVTV